MDNSANHTIFWELIGKILTSTANEKESKQFMGLILNDNELMEFYVKLQEYWKKLPELGPFELIDVEADWKQVHDMILEHERNIKPGSGSTRKFRHLAKRYLAYAAAMGAIIFLSWLYFSYSQSVKDAQKGAGLITHIEAPLGSRSHVILPDGSAIWLNAGSSLSYTGDFLRREREVSLVGEAFFKVEEQDIPFVVRTREVSLIVLGTSFNLKAYDDDDVIEATLVSGSLLIEDASEKAKRFNDLVLKPNQKATFHRVSGDLALQKEPDAKTEEEIVAHEARPLARIEVRQKQSVIPEISWREGILVVEGEPLAELARKLERRYDVKFVFVDQNLENFKYSGTLKDQTLEQVLQAMKLTSPIDYTLQEKTVTLRINQATKHKYRDYLN